MGTTKENKNILSRATPRQKKVAGLLIENANLDKPLNGGEILQKAGYNENLSRHPAKVIESIGVQEELESSGFTESNAKTIVSEIMLNPDAKDADRLKAGDMVFKVTGTYAPEKKAVVNLHIDATNKEAQDIADKYEEELKGKLLE